MRSRAWRRQQEFKKKRYVFKNHNNWWKGDWSPRMIGIRSHTPTLCSCWMCGNPRKYFNDKTIQEMRHEV